MKDTANTAQPENWSWGKFFGGIFNGLNTGKAIVTTIHQIVIALIVGSVIFLGSSVWKHYHTKKEVAPPPPITITTNNGKVATSADDRRKTCIFLNFCW